MLVLRLMEARIAELKKAATERLLSPFQFTCNNVCYVFTIDDIEKHILTNLSALNRSIEYSVQRDLYVGSMCDNVSVFTGKYYLSNSGTNISKDGAPSFVDELRKRLLHCRVSVFEVLLDYYLCTLRIEIDIGDELEDRVQKKARFY
jgi:hypothetical protein